MTFFGGGGLLLTAGLAGVWVWMKRTRHARRERSRPAGARRNSARGTPPATRRAACSPRRCSHRPRSCSSRSRASADSRVREFLDKNGGSGGFNLIAETTCRCSSRSTPAPAAPISKTAADGVRRIDTEPRYAAISREAERRRGVPAAAARRRRRELHEPLPGRAAARARRAEVAHRARRVQVLRDEASDARGEGEPVAAAERSRAPDGAIPVFCEQNTAQWMLKTAVGDEIKMPGDDGNERHVPHRRHVRR